MAAKKFRWSKDNGMTWTETEQTLPYTLPGVTSADAVLVEAIGSTVRLPASLGPSTASFVAGSSPGTVIASITGLDPGETVVSIVPNDGRLAINAGGNQLVVGVSASSVGAIAATLTTSAGRTLSLSVTATSLPYTVNFDATHLSRWKTKRDAGTALIAMPGDSRIAGYGIGTAGIGNARPQGPSEILRARLGSKGFSASGNSYFGTAVNGGIATIQGFDQRLTSYTGTVTQAVGDFGGQMFFMSSAGSITFTTQSCTDIKLFYPKQSGLGSFSYSIDGGTATTISEANASQAIGVIDVSGLASTTHTITIAWVSGNVYFIGWRGYNSASPVIQVLNGGHFGTTAVQWNVAGAYGYREFVAALSPDLVIVALGTNDTTGAGWETAMTGLVNRWKTASDVVMVIPGPTGTGLGWSSIQDDIHTRALALAATLDVACVDLYSFCGSFAARQAAGKMFDNGHENLTGYTDEWQMIADYLASV